MHKHVRQFSTPRNTETIMLFAYFASLIQYKKAVNIGLDKT